MTPSASILRSSSAALVESHKRLVCIFRSPFSIFACDSVHTYLGVVGSWEEWRGRSLSIQQPLEESKEAKRKPRGGRCRFVDPQCAVMDVTTRERTGERVVSTTAAPPTTCGILLAVSAAGLREEDRRGKGGRCVGAAATTDVVLSEIHLAVTPSPPSHTLQHH
jgi:hypothetical protein